MFLVMYPFAKWLGFSFYVNPRLRIFFTLLFQRVEGSKGRERRMLETHRLAAFCMGP